jgi:hypothetical protein
MGADKDVTTKLILQGEASGMVAAMEQAKNSATGMVTSVQSGLGSLGSAYTGLFGIVATAATVLGGGALFKDAISTTKDVASEVIKLSKAFGITTEDASVLRVALDDAFLTVDDAVGASDRLTRASIKNSDVFKKIGIDIRDGQTGALKDSLAVMTEVNDYLKTLKEGKERDTVAMALYGKGWRDLSGILRLTTDGMKEAKDRAEELHLVFGDDKIKMVKEYKLAMKDIDDVAESLKTQVGLALIPELTRLAVQFGDTAVEIIPPFINGMHSISAEVTRMAMLVDKAGGSMTTFNYAFYKTLELGTRFVTIGQFGDSFKNAAENSDKLNKMYSQRYADNEKILIKMAMAESGLDENGNPLVKKAAAKPAGRAPDNMGGSAATDRAAAAGKYLEYEKAFEERRAGMVKIASDALLEVNRQEYEQGLSDFRTYLETKQALAEEALYADVVAKKAELIAAQKAMKTAETSEVKDKKGNRDTDKENSNVYEAWQKEEQAQKALAEAVGKLALEKKKGSAETAKMTEDVNRGYRETQAQMLDMQGKYVEGAMVRKQLEEESLQRRQLIANAMTGDAAAEQAYWDAEALGIEKVATIRYNEQISENAMLSVWAATRAQNQADELAGTQEFHAMQAAQRGSATENELLRIDRERAAMEQSWAMNTSSEVVYQERMLQLTLYYEQEKTKVKQAETSKQMQLSAGAFGNMATIADAFYQLSGKKSKAAFKVYQATKSGETVISTADGAMKAYSALSGIPYAGPALGALAAAAVVAAGAVQLNNIWSASPDGGSGSVGSVSGGSGYSGSSGSIPVTQPLSSSTTTPPLNVTFAPVFHGPVDQQALTRWTEEYMLPTLRDLKTRGVTA